MEISGRRPMFQWELKGLRRLQYLSSCHLIFIIMNHDSKQFGHLKGSSMVLEAKQVPTLSPVAPIDPRGPTAPCRPWKIVNIFSKTMMNYSAVSTLINNDSAWWKYIFHIRIIEIQCIKFLEWHILFISQHQLLYFECENVSPNASLCTEIVC